MPGISRSVKIYSFDIFDTVVSRLVARPADLFLIVEQLLVQEDGSRWEDFGNLRSAAELNIRQRNNFTKEVTLDEIYDEIKQIKNLDTDAISKARNCELKLEADYLYPVPEIKKRIAELREEGNKILFISDTYLPKEFVRSQLLRFDLLQPADQLYVSSESRMMKSTGELYHAVMRDNNVDSDDITHCGDNEQSDFSIPIRLGIKADLFSEAKQTKYETAFIKSRQNVDFIKLSIFAGIMRKARTLHAPTQI